MVSCILLHSLFSTIALDIKGITLVGDRVAGYEEVMNQVYVITPRCICFLHSPTVCSQ